MVKFLDGPAAGQILQLRRAPVMLRVVQRPGTVTFDALDQLDDEPQINETIWLYRLTAPAMRVHLCIRGKGKGGSGWYAVAEYRYVPEQPADADMRVKELWEKWATANYELFKLQPTPATGE